MVVIGENRKYLVALLTLKVEMDLITGESKDKISEEANVMLRREGFLKEGESLGKGSEAAIDAKVLEFIGGKVRELN